MHTYAIRAAVTKTTGHYRRPGTMTTYCTGAPTDLHANTGKTRRMCTRCVKAEQRDRAHAEEVAAQHAEPIALAAELTEWERDLLAADIDPTPRYTTADENAAADTEARYAAQLVTEAEATDGTWRGEWIGQATADGHLFTMNPDREQGALFA
ncbi:hypothetical protein ABTZ57_16050 [Streptomyces sp. NPDC094048]|uniref:hypothetical protein n=1 Tax=Streptomyces sp. NPDC094048 TaxID=3155207 RepID=UPI00331BCCB6